MNTLNINNFLKTEFFKVAIGICLIAASAQIAIPFKPVPISLQSPAIIMIGLLFQRETALKTVAGYLMLGLIGVPVFANYGFGAMKFMGPSGGYLVGFFMAALVMTTLREKFDINNYKKQIGVGTIGLATVYICGVIGLSRFMDPFSAIQIGVLPYLPIALVKCIGLSSVIHYLKK